MKDFVKRMIEEHSALNEKTKKLESFIYSDKFKELNDEKKDLLYAQFYAMCSYLCILGRRITLESE